MAGRAEQGRAERVVGDDDDDDDEGGVDCACPTKGLV